MYDKFNYLSFIIIQLITFKGFLLVPAADPISEIADPSPISLRLLVGAALLTVPVPLLLLLSI
jgi:hypothetical protein